MIQKLRNRLQAEEGFTLIELLVVLIIIGILLAIAVPSYLGFKDKANQTAAEANVRAAVPAAEGFYADHNTYAGLDLSAYDAGLAAKVTVVSSAADAYCLQAVPVGGKLAHINGPGGSVEEGNC